MELRTVSLPVTSEAGEHKVVSTGKMLLLSAQVLLVSSVCVHALLNIYCKIGLLFINTNTTLLTVTVLLPCSGVAKGRPGCYTLIDIL